MCRWTGNRHINDLLILICNQLDVAPLIMTPFTPLYWLRRHRLYLLQRTQRNCEQVSNRIVPLNESDLSFKSLTGRPVVWVYFGMFFLFEFCALFQSHPVVARKRFAFVFGALPSRRSVCNSARGSDSHNSVAQCSYRTHRRPRSTASKCYACSCRHCGRSRTRDWTLCWTMSTSKGTALPQRERHGQLQWVQFHSILPTAQRALFGRETRANNFPKNDSLSSCRRAGGREWT